MTPRSTAVRNVLRRKLHAMGNTVSITAVADTPDCAANAVGAAVRRITELEHLWSRFRPDSEISRFNENRLTGEPSTDTVLLLNCMHRATVATDGLFDARILPEMLRIGYRASLVDRNSSSTANHADAVDPGGIGKGLAADLTVEAMLTGGCTGALVSIGGDLRCAGTPDLDAGWIIDIESDGATLPVGRITLSEGGVATSALRAKSWEGLESHQSHVIDPISRRSINPETSEVTQATVVASSAMWAESFATACLVADTGAALALLDRSGLAGLLVSRDGSVFTSINWRDFE